MAEAQASWRVSTVERVQDIKTTPPLLSLNMRDEPQGQGAQES
jgi:hypothetical protein